MGVLGKAKRVYAGLKTGSVGVPPPAVSPVPGCEKSEISEKTPLLVVRNAAELGMVLAALDHTARVGLDLETTALNPREGRVRLLSLAVDTLDGGPSTYLVDCFAVDPAPLFDALAEKTLVGHNLVFDLPFLARLGFEPGPVLDTMLLSQVLHAGRRLKHRLQDCADRELGWKLDKDLQKSDWSGGLTPDQLNYAAADVAVLRPLGAALEAKVKAAGLERAAGIEMRALPAVAWMTRVGVPFDRDAWARLADQARAEADGLAKELDASSPPRDGHLAGVGGWNWDSPAQVQQALAAVGVDVESTADEALARVSHPLADLLRKYRAARKRCTTYGPEWLKHVSPDGRVYPHWRQLGAESSGRMSCSDPNMQQVPRGECRRCVKAPAGRVLVKADYSQIELRIAARVSGDAAMLDAYRKGLDLHTLTAQRLLGKEAVTKEDRQVAKSANFGLLYGMGARGYRDYAKTEYGLDLTQDQAAAYRRAFFAAYPGLAAWHRKVGARDQAVETRTLTGRRRLDVARFTEKLNTPVQGTGADGLKTALALLWERRREVPGAFPVLAVHDEIVVECDEGQAAAVSAWLRAAMLDGMAPLADPVPVGVEVRSGAGWGG